MKPGRKCENGIATVGWKHYCARCGLWEDIADREAEAAEWIRRRHLDAGDVLKGEDAMTKPRYISEPLKLLAKEMLVRPHTIDDIAEHLGVSKHHARFTLDAIGAEKKGKTKPSKGAGRPWDLWGMP